MTTATRLAFTLDAKPLAAATAWAARRVPAKPTIPILGGILLDVTDGRLTLTGFDYDVSAQARVPVEGASDGRALVSGRLLAELVKTFPAKPVVARVDDDVLSISCGTVHLTLPLMTVEDYPALPAAPAAIGTVDGGVFATAVERVAVAADATGAAGLVVLTGVHMTLRPGQIQLLASNRYRGAMATIPWAGDVTEEVVALVPVTVVAETARAVLDGEVLDIAVTDGLVSFTTPGRTIVARLIDPKDFPVRLPDLIPPRADEPIVVPVAEVGAAVKRAQLVLEPKTPVRLTFTDGAVTVAGARDRDKVDEEIAIDYAGDPLTIAVNPGYLVEGLAALQSEVAELSIANPNRMFLVTAPGDSAYRHVIQPIRLPGKE